MKFVGRIQMGRQLFDEKFHRANVGRLEVIQSGGVQFVHRTGRHRMIGLNETMPMRTMFVSGRTVSVRAAAIKDDEEYRGA